MAEILLPQAPHKMYCFEPTDANPWIVAAAPRANDSSFIVESESGISPGNAVLVLQVIREHVNVHSPSMKLSTRPKKSCHCLALIWTSRLRYDLPIIDGNCDYASIDNIRFGKLTFWSKTHRQRRYSRRGKAMCYSVCPGPLMCKETRENTRLPPWIDRVELIRKQSMV